MEQIKDLDTSLFFRRPDVDIDLWKDLRSKYFKEKGYLYFCSSGTTSSKIKVFEISFLKMLGHAKEMNHFFNIKSTDRWLLSLPSFYMGGISIMFRAYENGASIFSPSDLSIEAIVSSCQEHSITHLSLVPRQIHDFLKKNLSFPDSVKMVFIGGDSLSVEDFNLLKRHPSIFYPTYGASEVCSQVATSTLDQYNTFSILPWNNVSVKKTVEITSPFIFDRLFTVDSFGIVKEQASELVFKTNDMGTVEGNSLTIFGRSDRKIKCSGLFIDLDHLEEQIKKSFLLDFEFYLTSLPSRSRGQEPVVISKDEIDLSSLKQFNIFHIRIVKNFEYTPSGKLKKIYL